MKKFHRQVLLLFIGIFLGFTIIIKLFCYRKLVWKWAGLVNKTLAFASILISTEQYTQEYFPHMFLSTCYCICLFKQFYYIPRVLALPVDLRWSHEQAVLQNSWPQNPGGTCKGEKGSLFPIHPWAAQMSAGGIVPLRANLQSSLEGNMLPKNLL